MSVIAAPFTRTLSRKLLAPWWLFLLTGIGWMLVALIVLRFDYKSVNAIAILFGIVAITAGVLEIGVTILAEGWWKLLYGLLAVVFIAAGVVSFIHPGDTFLALAAVMSFVLILAGTFDIIIAISARKRDRGLVAAAGRGDHRAPARVLGGRLLRSQRDPPGRLGGSLRRDSGRDGHRARLSCSRAPARFGVSLKVWLRGDGHQILAAVDATTCREHEPLRDPRNPVDDASEPRCLPIRARLPARGRAPKLCPERAMQRSSPGRRSSKAGDLDPRPMRSASKADPSRERPNLHASSSRPEPTRMRDLDFHPIISAG